MEIVTIILLIISGIALLALSQFIFSLKVKSAYKFALNSIAAATLMLLLSLANIVVLPFNALTVSIVAIGGLPGLAAVYVLTFLI